MVPQRLGGGSRIRTALVSAVGDIQHPLGLSDARRAVEQSIGAGAVRKALGGSSEGRHFAGCHVDHADVVAPRWLIPRWLIRAPHTALVLRDEERLLVI